MAAKPRVVVYTNVLVSAFAFGGVPEKAVSAVIHETEAWVSPLLLEEYRETTQELFASRKINRSQFQALLTGLASFTAHVNFIRPRKSLVICRDPEDNMVLECCRAARARFLITGDKDLLELEGEMLQSARLQRLKILTPQDFLREISLYRLSKSEI
ncbi:putative toxin-antitoxin system toxin component, PIN family [Candidatus Acetothermia bacterium]|nr:putative toxin-antitoxin system toxin component, PIN family [Candidatus Acetothermia bacterium]